MIERLSPIERLRDLALDWHAVAYALAATAERSPDELADDETPMGAAEIAGAHTAAAKYSRAATGLDALVAMLGISEHVTDRMNAAKAARDAAANNCSP